MSTKVSVCMIAYKHEAFVAQAINSVLSQKGNFELELVIGEDQGPDGTRTICEQYAARDSRVRLLPSDRNHGVMANFRRTLAACDGEFVAVCEGDDYWTDPFKLSKQVATLEAHPDFAGSAHQSLVISLNNAPNRLFRTGVPQDVGIDDLLGGRLFHTASIVFRRSVLETFLPAPDVLSADRLVNLCIALHGRIHYSDEVMCAYRLHGGGMSSNATVAQMRRDLASVPYLRKVNPDFPRYRYLSYVYATIGMTRNGRVAERFWCLILSFVYSFSYFPKNLTHLMRWFHGRWTRRA
jgi:glycosyltransferase involved in cell wall biosynthesis